MNPDELLKMDHNKEIVMIRGKKPFICDKYDYLQHPEIDKLEDITLEELKEKYKENIENDNKNIVKENKIKLTFKDF